MAHRYRAHLLGAAVKITTLPYLGPPKIKAKKPFITAAQEAPYEHQLAADSKGLTLAYEMHPSDQDVFEEVARIERNLGMPLALITITITHN